jgi:hypothetical protein
MARAVRPPTVKAPSELSQTVEVGVCSGDLGDEDADTEHCREYEVRDGQVPLSSVRDFKLIGLPSQPG